jgi:hypothetical protein
MEISQCSKTITELPYEIINLFYSMLTLEDAKSFGKTNKTFRKIYLENVAKTKYITNAMYQIKNEPKIDISKFIQDILENIRLGNRYIYLDMASADEGNKEMYIIVNVTASTSYISDITLHVLNKYNKKMISFCSEDNAIYEQPHCASLDNRFKIKLITLSPFNQTMRPLYIYYNSATRVLKKSNEK